MNLKQYLYLYDLLQQLITKQITLYGPKVIGRWPLIELHNISEYPIKQISEFFATVLQYNTKLHQKIVNDAKYSLQELKQELESIEILSDKEAALDKKALAEVELPAPDETIVNELLYTLFDTPEPEKEEEVKEEIEEASPLIPTPPINKEEYKQMSEQIKALLEIGRGALDEIYVSAEFTVKLEGIPQKVLKLIAQGELLTGRQIAAKLELDVNKEADLLVIGFIVKELGPQLIKASDYINK